MKVYVYPADLWACGHYRLIWPAVALQALGHDVTIVDPSDRGIAADLNADGTVRRMSYPADADVLVFQRITHKTLAQGIAHFVRAGVAVVVDVDDDLAAIHPDNPAWRAYHPDWRRYNPASSGLQSWANLQLACRDATMVTTSTDALAARYAPHGRFRVLRNRIPERYLDVPHADSDLIGWPASLHSHPNDPAALGNSIAQLVREGARFHVMGSSPGTGRAFGLDADPPTPGDMQLGDWPRAVASLGIGVCPLADTRFNAAKSHLKPLELAALGVPWVGSPRSEYAWLHALGTGTLAERSRDWYRALRALLDSPARRAEESARGREVAAGLTIEGGAETWGEAWVEARKIATRLHKQPVRPIRMPRQKAKPAKAKPKWSLA